MLLTCPRCDAVLDDPTDTGTADRVAGHECSACKGVWLPGERVKHVYPALRDHGARVSGLLANGACRPNVVACPSCAAAMTEFPFFDLWLDLCDGCHGIWIDGAETEFVRKYARHESGLPGTGDADARVDCPCGRQVHPRRALLTGEGPLCDNCVGAMRVEASSPVGRALNKLTGFLDFMGRQGKRRWVG